jgi:hypothetical protein
MSINSTPGTGTVLLLKTVTALTAKKTKSTVLLYIIKFEFQEFWQYHLSAVSLVNKAEPGNVLPEHTNKVQYLVQVSALHLNGVL